MEFFASFQSSDLQVEDINSQPMSLNDLRAA